MHYFTLCYTPGLDQNMIWYRCYPALQVAGQRRCAQAAVMVHCCVPWVWTHSGPTAITGSERMRINCMTLSHLHCVSLLKDTNMHYSGRLLCFQWMSHKMKPCLKFGVTRVWLWGWWGRAGDEGQHWLAHFGHAGNQFSFSGIRILKTLQNMSENTDIFIILQKVYY